MGHNKLSQCRLIIEWRQRFGQNALRQQARWGIFFTAEQFFSIKECFERFESKIIDNWGKIEGGDNWALNPK